MTEQEASQTTATEEHEASRTLVKSPPELWAECSDAASLSRHLGEPFGEIRITRLEPETAVAWEGDRASGTVRLEPSGWGTRVTLTAGVVTSYPSAAPARAEPELLPEVPVERPAEPAAAREARGRPWDIGQARAEPESYRAPVLRAVSDAPVVPPPVDRVVGTAAAVEASSEPEGDTQPRAEPDDRPQPPAPAAQDVTGPGAAADVAPPPRRGLLKRLRKFFANQPEMPAETAAPVVALGPRAPAPVEQLPIAPVEQAPAAPAATAVPAPVEVVAAVEDRPGLGPSAQEPEPAAGDQLERDTKAVLAAALESLGKAHHRPYSRAGTRRRKT